MILKCCAKNWIIIYGRLMGFLIKAITRLFLKKTDSDLNKENPDEDLPIFTGKIEVGKYLSIKDNKVNRSADYLFRTPDEILKILNHGTLLWVDEKNDLLGYSSVESKLFVLSEVKGFEIQNVLPAKGAGIFLDVIMFVKWEIL
jgi:hypothetical protein